MNKNSRTYNSTLNMITGFGSQILLTILQFVCRTVFISCLGKEYLGINGLFSNILSLLSLTELGIDAAMNYKLYRPLKENDFRRIRVLMKFYRQAYMVIGVTILALGLCLIPFLKYLVKDYETFALLGLNPILVYMLFLLQSVSSYLFFSSRSAIIKADQREYITTITTFICTVVLNIVQMVTLLIWKNFILYTALAIGNAVLINLINAIIAKIKYKEAFKYTPEHLSREELRDTFKDLGALFLFKVDNAVLKATDNIVLSSFLGLAIVGVYSNYLVFYTAVRTILARVYNAVRASMGNLYADNDIDKQYRFFEIMNFITFILYGTAAAGVAVIADEVVRTWIGGDYVIAQPFSVLMGIEILFFGIKLNLDQIRNVTGAFRQMWYRPILSIVINIAVSVIGVQTLGINGVLIGTISSNFLTNILYDPRIIHKYSLKYYRPVSVYYIRNIVYFALLTLVTLSDMLICNNIFTGQGWFSVFIHTLIVGGSVPLAFILICWKRHECVYLRRTIKRIILPKAKLR